MFPNLFVLLLFCDDDVLFNNVYENGYWKWDNVNEELQFVSYVMNLEDFDTHLNIIRNVEFKMEMDIVEEQKFKKRYQRRTNGTDVVMLQDVKDIVMFMAPVSILSPAVINVLHLPATERFLRALILYCQYYMQIFEVMDNRQIEGEKKIRTINSDNIELKYRDNIEDLRMILAKEYALFLLGIDQYSDYHHMDNNKKYSLSKKDAVFMDTLIRIAVQIAWVALGRKHYKKIELEVHRIFKSDLYNDVEHKMQSSFKSKMSLREKSVIYGHCLKHGKKLNSKSPLINELFCHRHIDEPLFGIASYKYSSLSTRLKYLEKLLSEPEKKLRELDINIGILGLPRNDYDIMLREKKIPTKPDSVSGVKVSTSRLSHSSKSSRKSTGTVRSKGFPEIFLPDRGSYTTLCELPHESIPPLPRNDVQRRKWLRRARLRHKRTNKF